MIMSTTVTTGNSTALIQVTINGAGGTNILAVIAATLATTGCPTLVEEWLTGILCDPATVLNLVTTVGTGATAGGYCVGTYDLVPT
jgi:hypothetical protein